MAKLVESRSKKPVRDVREFEEQRVLQLPQALRLEQTLTSVINTREWRDPLFRDAYAVRILLRTGVRRFEFCKLRIGDVEDDKLRVVGKGNIKDYVPLFPAAAAAIAEWVAWKSTRGEDTSPKAFMFVGHDGPVSFSTVRLGWKKILELAGLPDHYGLHALRHTAGLIVYAQTADLAATARFLRHTDIKTTAKFYLHVDVEQLRAQLGKVDIWKT